MELPSDYGWFCYAASSFAAVIHHPLTYALTFDIKTSEEFYYLMMGIQYPITPLLVTERQWRITGIDSSFIDSSFLCISMYYFYLHLNIIFRTPYSAFLMFSFVKFYRTFDHFTSLLFVICQSKYTLSSTISVKFDTGTSRLAGSRVYNLLRFAFLRYFFALFIGSLLVYPVSGTY